MKTVLTNPWFYLFLIYSYVIPMLFGAGAERCREFVYLYLFIVINFGVIIPKIDELENWLNEKNKEKNKF